MASDESSETSTEWSQPCMTAASSISQHQSPAKARRGQSRLAPCRSCADAIAALATIGGRDLLDSARRGQSGDPAARRKRLLEPARLRLLHEARAVGRANGLPHRVSGGPSPTRTPSLSLRCSTRCLTAPDRRLRARAVPARATRSPSSGTGCSRSWRTACGRQRPPPPL